MDSVKNLHGIDEFRAAEQLGVSVHTLRDHAEGKGIMVDDVTPESLMDRIYLRVTVAVGTLERHTAGLTMGELDHVRTALDGIAADAKRVRELQPKSVDLDQMSSGSPWFNQEGQLSRGH